jgi:hypothetical protein
VRHIENFSKTFSRENHRQVTTISTVDTTTRATWNVM